MNLTFKRILLVELVVAVVVIVFLLAGRANNPSVKQSQMPTPSSTMTQQSNLVDSCSTVVPAKSSNEQWESAPELNLDDERNFWTLATNCGDIVIEIFAEQAPISANSLKFLTDQKYYDGTPCHRLTASSFFVVQCGDPLGTGIGNPGYQIMEENRPTTGSSNYPAGTVALAKGPQPNTSGAQFFIVYRDTTLRPDYSVVGRVIAGLEIVNTIAEAGILGDVKDGKPKQNFGILNATLSKKKPSN